MRLFTTIGQILATERKALQHVQASLSETQRRLAHLRAEVSGLERHEEALRLRAAAATGICGDLVLRFMREFFDTIPDDVLLLIFEEVVSASEGWGEEGMHFDKDLAQAPFRLAAVCQRWRHLAVSYPILWTYLALPEYDDLNQAHVERIENLLCRSQQAPIDVFADWDCHELIDTVGPYAEAITRLIGSLGHRLRLFSWSSLNVSTDAAFEGLRGPTPHLTQLYIDPASEVRRSSLEVFLPFAPRIEVIQWYSEYSVWSFAAQRYASLITLTIGCDPPLDSVVNAMRVVRDSLQELNLGPFVSPDPFGQSVCLELPRLTTLRIWDWGWAKYLCAPALRRLASGNSWSRDGDYFGHILRPFVTVQHLALFAPCDVVELTPLTELVNITTLEVCGTTWGKRESCGKLSDGFFAAAVDFESPIWPKLKHIHFDNGRGFDHITPVSDTDLVTFLRLRNETPATELEPRSTSRIETVKLGYDAPEWLIREVERLTALH